MARFHAFKATLLLIVLGLLASLNHLESINLSVYAGEPWGEVQSGPNFQHLPDIENQLYGHAYPDQSTGQRISRIEKTLLGTSIQGSLELRMQQIMARMQAQKTKATQASQEPMLAYLEEKLFLRTFPEKPLTERLRQLELQVFGRSFEQYPQALRLKKLTYAMPLVTKEVRLTKGDVVIARANQTAPKAYRTGTVSETVQLDTKKPTTAHSPNTIQMRTDDYFTTIHRISNGAVLRWIKLPIRVYTKPSNFEATTEQALQSWQTAFSIEPTASAPQADVIVSWEKSDWDQNPAATLIRPIIRVDDNGNIRTVILITLYPIHGQTASQLLHVTSHELGHAFGLWGHSDDPDDLMYPALTIEANDFPSRWRWRSENTEQATVPVNGYRPSQRDINTLLRVYDQPASDLSTYTP